MNTLADKNVHDEPTDQKNVALCQLQKIIVYNAYRHWSALVAKVILATLFGPLGVDVILRPLVRPPAQPHRAFLDRVSFLSLVALNRVLDRRSVDDLATARQIALRQQLLLDLFEYLAAYTGLRQRSQNSQIVLASGMLVSVRSRKRRKLRRSSK